MLHPLSHLPADRARLARIGRVDIDHGDTDGLGLVSHKVLQLPEGPTMQASSDTITRFDVGADMRQVLHADFSHGESFSFLHNRFADFVIHMLNMPLFTTRDSAQCPFGGTATVGLETTTMGQVFVPVKTQLPATQDLATTCGGEIILSDIHSQDASTFHGSRVRNIQNKLKIPNCFTNDQFGLFRYAAGQQVVLMPTANKRDMGTTAQGKQRDPLL